LVPAPIEHSWAMLEALLAPADAVAAAALEGTTEGAS